MSGTQREWFSDRRYLIVLGDKEEKANRKMSIAHFSHLSNEITRL